jgi:hypothetical protein
MGGEEEGRPVQLDRATDDDDTKSQFHARREGNDGRKRRVRR